MTRFRMVAQDGAQYADVNYGLRRRTEAEKKLQKVNEQLAKEEEQMKLQSEKALQALVKLLENFTKQKTAGELDPRMLRELVKFHNAFVNPLLAHQPATLEDDMDPKFAEGYQRGTQEGSKQGKELEKSIKYLKGDLDEIQKRYLAKRSSLSALRLEMQEDKESYDTEKTSLNNQLRKQKKQLDEARANSTQDLALKDEKITELSNSLQQYQDKAKNLAAQLEGVEKTNASTLAKKDDKIKELERLIQRRDKEAYQLSEQTSNDRRVTKEELAKQVRLTEQAEDRSKSLEIEMARLKDSLADSDRQVSEKTDLYGRKCEELMAVEFRALTDLAGERGASAERHRQYEALRETTNDLQKKLLSSELRAVGWEASYTSCQRSLTRRSQLLEESLQQESSLQTTSNE